MSPEQRERLSFKERERQARFDRYVCAALTGILAAQPAGVTLPGGGRDFQDSKEVGDVAVEYATHAMAAADRSL